MKTAIKAALAVTAGGVLLLGGAGSLAYWNDTRDVQPNTTLTSGTLKLGAPTCGNWEINGVSTADPAAMRIVPGDNLTRVCEFQISVTGDYLEAQLTATAPTMDDSFLEDELAFTVTYERDTDVVNDDTNETTIDPVGSPVTFTSSDDGHYLRAFFEVDFPFNATPTALDNDSNGGVTAQLNAITVTATQTDATP